MKIHHIGIACRDIVKEIEYIKGQYDVTHVSNICYDELQNATVCLIETNNNICIELVSGDRVKPFIEKGVSLYHTCFLVDDIFQTIEKFVAHGAVLVSEAKPAKLFNGRLVAFVQTSLGLVEFLEDTDAKKVLESDPLSSAGNNKTQIVIAANYTFDSAVPMLDFFLKECGFEATDIQCAPFNQIHQQLLEPESIVAQNLGINVILLKIDEWTKDISDIKEIKNKLNEFVSLIQSTSHIKKIPLLICFCKPSPALFRKENLLSAYQQLEKEIIEQLELEINVYTISSEDIDFFYPVINYYDDVSYDLARIPYSNEYLAALCVAVVRKIAAIRRTSYECKAIIVDCDDTLWGGVCAEQPPSTLLMDASYQFMQAFLKLKHSQGILICLCSKNEQSDVMAVFKERTDFALKIDHIATSRFNWEKKSRNIESIAKELNIGLNNILFIDNNPIECEEVRAALPDIFVVDFPSNSKEVELCIKNIWILDKIKLTSEDKARAVFYKENQKRRELESTTRSLKEFIDSLKITLTFFIPKNEEIERISQLSKRTTQFNFNNLTYSAEQIATQMRQDAHCYGVKVSDTFGEHGIVAGFIFSIKQNCLVINNLYISCRVLGKGVEYSILNKIGDFAKKYHVDAIKVCFCRSKRNTPAFIFLQNAAFKREASEGINESYLITTTDALALKPIFFNEKKEGIIQDVPVSIESLSSFLNEKSLLEKILKKYPTAESILNAYKEGNVVKRAPLSQQHEFFQDDIEKKISKIWEATLKIFPINVFENYYQLGGDSLVATQIVAEICNLFSIRLTLEEFFESPSINETAALVRSKIESHSQQHLPQIMHLDKTKAYPLSFSQERLWFLEQLEPGRAIYNTFLTLRLVGKLNVEALKNAFQYLVERHESLRTGFIYTNSNPLQSLFEVDDINTYFKLEDIQELNHKEIYKKVRDLAQVPFDLSRAPLIRIHLLKKQTNHYYLSICLHHIINDTWSFDILCKEVSHFYNAILTFSNSSLKKIKYSYFDYAVWQKQLFQKGFFNNQVVYWKNKLSDLPPLILKSEKSATAIDKNLYRGKRIYLKLPVTLSSTIKKQSIEKEISAFTIFFSIFTIALSRYSSQKDFAIGVPASGRIYAEFNDVIGFFVNILALRSDVDENLKFIDYLLLCKKNILEAEANQSVPFDKLVEILNPLREIGKNPLCQVMFVYVSSHSGTQILKLNGLETSRVFSENNDLQLSDFESSKFDMTLFIREKDNQYDGLIEFNTNLFDDKFINRFMNHFIRLGENAFKDVGVAIKHIPMLSPKEQRLMLETWNATDSKIPDVHNFYYLFLEQVKQHPTKIAVSHNDENISYAKLDMLSQQYAAYFLEKKIPEGALVACLLERDIHSVAILIALLAINAIVVPIDVHNTKNYTLSMLSHKSICYLIADKHYFDADDKKNIPNICVLFKEEIAFPEGLKTFDNFVIQNQCDSAFVLFTSGSTGKPKGIFIAHRAIINLAKNSIPFSITSKDVMGQTSSLAFDASLFEIWGALLNGATLIIIDRDKLISTHDFSAVLKKKPLTILFLTAALFNQLASIDLNLFFNIQYVITGGEPLNPAIIHKVLNAKKPPKNIVNGYGPTECGVFTTFNVFNIFAAGECSVPIGKPISNMKVYVLDRYRNPVPVGVPGELYIGGLGVSKGYFDALEQNNSKFISNAYGLTPLYKTGDLVRWLDDGNLEFITRNDNLIKIRGYRVDPEMIEHVLLEHPKIKQAAVVIVQNTSTLIIAYVVQADASLTQADLIQYTKRCLPHYMLPHSYIFVDAFPLTNNGKINKKKLLETGASHVLSNDHYSVPTTKLEAILQDIFAQVLHLQPEAVSVTKSFFDMGGHSLLVIKLIDEIQKKLSVQIEVRKILMTPSVRELANAIDTFVLKQKNITLAQGDKKIIQLRHGKNQSPLFFIHPVGGTIFCYLDLVKNLKTARACFAIEDPSISEGVILFDNIPDMAKHYISLIDSEIGVKEYILLGHSFGGMVALEMAKQLEQANKNIAFLGIIDTWIASALDEPAKVLLKTKMTQKIKTTTTSIIECQIENVEPWVKLNFHRLQTLGFNFFPKKINQKIYLFKAMDLGDDFSSINENTNYLSQYTSKGVEVYLIPGNHETILEGENVKVLAKTIDDILPKCRE